MAKHLILGKAGEDRVAERLRKDGWRIVARNYRWRETETDIIACKGGRLVFVEVKTRSHEKLARAEEAVNLRKQHTLTRSAEAFLRQHGQERPSWWPFGKRFGEMEIRFDIAAVIDKGGEWEIRYTEDAFRPTRASRKG